jgi:hypothetical protein
MKKDSLWGRIALSKYSEEILERWEPGNLVAVLINSVDRAGKSIF